MTNLLRCPRTLSKHLNDVGAQLNKQQAAAQDVSDSLRMLNQDMLEVKGRLVFTSVDFLPSITVPCMSIRKLSYLSTSLPFAFACPVRFFWKKSPALTRFTTLDSWMA